ncbi:MAG: hypothetical protein Q4E07_01155 [Eubacteriales bacterium]|nr:hypothetical protein [Eubacteriales bacterium]
MADSLIHSEDLKAVFYKFSQIGMELGLELSKLSYSLDMSDWIEDGWFDISIKIRNKIYGGIASFEEKNRLRSAFYNTLVPKIAKASSDNIITAGKQLSTLIDDPYSTERGRSVVLVKRLSSKKYVIAIGFAGTGKNFLSWLSNFGFEHDDGLHAGFNRIAEEFIADAESINFSTVAKELGLKKISLKDIFISIKSPDSPFKVFLAGHSQGAAVLQIMALKLTLEGAYHKNITAYGFAPPSTALNSFSVPQIPVYLVANQDDVFAKTGLEKHIGNYYLYKNSKEMREQCYGERLNNPLFKNIIDNLNSIQTTDEALLLFIAFMYALSYLPKEELNRASDEMGGIWKLPFLPDETPFNSTLLMRSFFRNRYKVLTGQEPDTKKLLPLALEEYKIIKRHGAVNVFNTAVAAIRATHSLHVKSEEKLLSCYAYILKSGFNELIQVKIKSI